MKLPNKEPMLALAYELKPGLSVFFAYYDDGRFGRGRVSGRPSRARTIWHPSNFELDAQGPPCDSYGAVIRAGRPNAAPMHNPAGRWRSGGHNPK
jgi:hypothetical protein